MPDHDESSIWLNREAAGDSSRAECHEYTPSPEWTIAADGRSAGRLYIDASGRVRAALIWRNGDKGYWTELGSGPNTYDDHGRDLAEAMCICDARINTEVYH